MLVAKFTKTLVIQQMLSVIVTDPKAENRDITIRHRESLGAVYALDLMTPANSDQFNPFDMIRVGTENEIDDAELIADLLITPDPRSASHWDDKARQGLTGFILYMVHRVDPVLRTLPELRRLVYQEPAAFQHTLMEMEEVPIDACQGAANDLLAMLKTDEGQSVFSSMRKALRLWSTDRPAGHVVSNSSFSLMSFKREVATLYIIIAPDKMQLYAPFMRLFAGLSLAAMTRDQPSKAKCQCPHYRNWGDACFGTANCSTHGLTANQVWSLIPRMTREAIPTLSGRRGVTVKLKHVHKVRSKGRIYYYAWRGGPRLQGEPGTPDFMSSYQEAWDHKKNSIQNGTLDALVVRYRESADFRNLRPLTRRDMTKALDRVRKEFGAMDLTAFEDIRMRQAILEWRDEWANKPRTADYMVGTLRRVLSFGKDRGLLGRNIAERIKPLYSVNRSHIIWTEAEIDKLCRLASPEIEAAVRLASLTGLRRGDLLKLPWNAIGEKSIVWQTSKTDAPVFNRMVKRWCTEVGLRGNYGSHTLRKTWGYHQRMIKNAPIPLLMEAFGHDTQAQTLGYLCIQAEEIQKLFALEL